jgi:hypothetical protein
MLKPLLAIPNRTQGNPDAYRTDILGPQRECEACHKQVPSEEAINVMILVGSPGHIGLAPFQCAHEEHWACSPECWLLVTHACIDEHMHEMLKYYRSTKGL